MQKSKKNVSYKYKYIYPLYRNKGINRKEEWLWRGEQTQEIDQMDTFSQSA
jgi:hypothetical protein